MCIPCAYHVHGKLTANLGAAGAQISLYVDNAVQMILICLVMVVLVMVVAPMLVPFGVTALLAYVAILVMTDRSSREVTRTSSHWRRP